jgi:hypothetical protein
MLPELFVQVYYYSLPLRSSLLRVWATSKRARKHTDVLLFERSKEDGNVSLQKFCNAAEGSRPWGVDLPVARSFCNCVDSDDKCRWKRTHTEKPQKFKEHFACFRSTCHHTDLQLAVFAEGFTVREINGTHIVVQDFDWSMGRFPLDDRRAYSMKVFSVSLVNCSLCNLHSTSTADFG